MANPLTKLKSMTIIPNYKRMKKNYYLRPNLFVAKGLKGGMKFPQVLSEEDKMNYLTMTINTPKIVFDTLKFEDKPLFDLVNFLKNLICKPGQKIPCIMTLHMVNRKMELFPHIHLVTSQDLINTVVGDQLKLKAKKANYVASIKGHPIGGSQTQIIGFCKYLQKAEQYIIGINNKQLLTVFKKSAEIPMSPEYSLDDIEVEEVFVDDDVDDVDDDDAKTTTTTHHNQFELDFLKKNPELAIYFNIEEPTSTTTFDEDVFQGVPGSSIPSTNLLKRKFPEPKEEETTTKVRKILSARDIVIDDMVNLALKKKWNTLTDIDVDELNPQQKVVFRKLRVNTSMRKEFLSSIQVNKSQHLDSAWESLVNSEIDENDAQFHTVSETVSQFNEFTENFCSPSEFLYNLHTVFRQTDGKKVGIKLYGAPSTGKTTWLDRCIATHLTIPVKIVSDNAFLFSKLPSGNCAVCNEIKFTDEQIEKMKDLMDQGTVKSVAVKNQGQEQFKHTHVWFFTHNSDFSEVLSDHSKQAINQRCFSYKLEHNSLIESHKIDSDGGKKIPNPMFFKKCLMFIDENLKDYHDMREEIENFMIDLI